MQKRLVIFLCLSFLVVFSTSIQAQRSEKKEVEQVLKAYKDGIENLSTEGLSELFTKDAQIFESGGIEGTFAHYLEHHLGPELGHFKSFDFSDHKIQTKVDLPYAFTTESYIYTIVLTEGDRTVQRKGVATTILKKIDGKWKIIKTHSSSRNVK